MRTLMTAALLMTAGCDLVDVGCTDYLAYSVDLALEDDAGNPVSGAVLSVTDGVVTEDCYDNGDGNYSCGAEMEGTLTISIDAAGFAPEDVEVVVAADECHVITQHVIHALSAVDCTTEARPSVQLSVSDEAGAPVAGAYATFSQTDADGIVDCEVADSGFICGYEVAGELQIFVDADGYESHSEIVDVALTEDGCHVETEILDVVLAAQ